MRNWKIEFQTKITRIESKYAIKLCKSYLSIRFVFFLHVISLATSFLVSSIKILKKEEKL